MDRVADLEAFVRVVESGSFSQAARELGLGQPAVSKKVAALEQRLGAQLLTRTSRGLRATPAGAEFYESAVRILRELENAESRAAEGHEQPRGHVRIAVPPVLTGMTIVPALPEFLQRFPGLSVEFCVSVMHADLVQEGLDLAIRIGRLDSSGLVARRIGSLRFATVASPTYLAKHGAPSTPADLHNHELLANRSLGAAGDWVFKHVEHPVVAPTSGRFSCNNPIDMRAAALAGLGIVQSARALFQADLEDGTVVEVLKDFVADPVPIHALYRGALVPHRVRVVADLIADCIANEPSLQLD